MTKDNSSISIARKTASKTITSKTASNLPLTQTHKSRGLTGVALLLCLLLVISCTRKKNNEYGLDIRETLRINIETEPPTLDHNKSSDSVSRWILTNIMEGLTNLDYNSPDLKTVPGLAESWESPDKGKTWIFKLRRGVKWTDGVELKAQHFVDSWERLLNAKTAAPYSNYLYSIKSAREYFEGKVIDFGEVGVKATEDFTLTVTLNSALSFFPSLMTYSPVFPFRKDIFEKYGNSAFADPEKMVTLGMYRVKLWEHDKAIVLERNEQYFGEKPKIKNILAYMIIEQSTALNLFDAGKLDAIPQFPATEMAKQKLRPEYRSHPILTLQYHGFNIKRKPLDNVWIRKAIASAIDKKQIVDLWGAGQTPATSWVPKGMFGYNEGLGLPYDLEKAKEYLAKAGVTDPSKLPKIYISHNTGEDHKRLAENLQAQLKKNLGLLVEIQNEEWKVYLESLRLDAPHIFRFAWGADYPDPDNFMSILTSTSENNHTKWKSKEFDQLVDKGVAEQDPAKRLILYNQAQKLALEEDVAVLPLYYSVRSKLISPRVINYPINSLDNHEYRYTSLKQ